MNHNLQQLLHAIDQAVYGKNEPQLLCPRGPGKWNAAQVLQHLSLTYSGTIKALDRCLEAGKPLASKPSLKQRIIRFAVTGLGYLPEGRKAPERTVPGENISGKQAVEEARSLIIEMDAKFEECRRRFGASIDILDHPILGPLSLHQWTRFHLVHGLHHVKQIKQACATVPLSARDSASAAG